MAQTAPRPARYEDLLDLPERLVGEILNGELHTSPRPASRHALTSSSLGFEIGAPFHRGRGGPGGWWILDEPELHLGEDIMVPDLAGWRRERMPTFPDVAWFGLAPDWVCEVLSPSTALTDRTRKLPLYAAHGVAWLWFVDPIPKLIEVLQLQDGAWTHRGAWGGDDVARLPPFDAIELELSGLWPPEPEAPAEE